MWGLIWVMVLLGAAAGGSLDSRCQSEAHCDVQHAQCTKGVCGCRVKYVPSKLKDACLPVADKGDYCKETEQCFSLGEYGECRQQHCACAENAHWDQHDEECVASSAGRASQVMVAMMTTFVGVRFFA